MRKDEISTIFKHFFKPHLLNKVLPSYNSRSSFYFWGRLVNSIFANCLSDLGGFDQFDYKNYQENSNCFDRIKITKFISNINCFSQ